MAARLDDIERLRMRRAGKDDLVALVAVVAQRHADGLGDRGRLVEQRGGSHRKSGQFGHERLEMEQQFQPSLADFRLVGRIGRVPGRILEQVALDDRRHMAAVIALADEALHDGVAVHHGLQLAKRRVLARRGGQVKRAIEPDRGRHGLGDQRFHGRDADLRQHGTDIGLRKADMAAVEGVGGGAHRVLTQAFSDRLRRPSGRRAGFHRRWTCSTAIRRFPPPS